MTETKFTKGPWAVGGDGYRVKPLPFDQFFRPVADIRPVSRRDAVNGEWVHASQEENKANAHLIAAAPDMYEALENVQKLISEGAVEGFNPHAGDWADRLYFSQQMTSTALSKARGES